MFWLDKFFFLAATTAAAAAAAEGWIYFAHVAVRKFTKITTESESFTILLIVSFLINIFYEVFSVRTLTPGFFMLLVVHKTSADYCYLIHTVARHGVKKAKGFTASEGGKSAAMKQSAFSPRSKQLVVQLFTPESLSYAITRVEGTWTESLKLQRWGSLMVQTRSQYFQYLFFNKHMKIGEY
jgi:hypothetical protein